MILYEYSPINEIQNELPLWIGPSDLESAQKITHQNKRRASLCVRALLYKKLFLETGVKGWGIEKDDAGKPFLVNDHTKIIPHISLSHSPTMVAVAISFSGPVGVDIEDWHQRDIQRMANYAFGPNEIKETSDEGLSAFYRIWTVREAIAKMSGAGILSLMNGEDVAFNVILGRQVLNDLNIIYEVINQNHSLAIASRG